MSEGFGRLFAQCEEQFGVLSKDEFEEQQSDAKAVTVEYGDTEADYHAVGLTEIGDSGEVILMCFDYTQIDEDGIEEIAEEQDLDLEKEGVQRELDSLRGETFMMLRNQVPYHNVNSISFTEDMNKAFS